MPPTRVSDQRIFDKLLEVFRLYGFEGASLSRISKATGLKRASLYHRFPGGKEEMALALLKRTREGLRSEILAPLVDSGNPAARVRSMATGIHRFYKGGRRSCLLDTLSLGTSPVLRASQRAMMREWRDAMASLAREAALLPTTARRRAEDALVGIEGALILARVSGDLKPFSRVMKGLPSLLTDPDAN